MGVPWFKFYPNDFLSDSKVRALDDASRGFLVLLWCLCAKDGGFPKDPIALGRLVSKRHDHAHQSLIKVASFFVDDPHHSGFMTSTRLLEEMALYESKCNKNRECGKLGGYNKHKRTVKRMPPDSEKRSVPESESESEKDISASQRKVARKVRGEVKESLKDVLEWDELNWAPVFWKVLEPFPSYRKKYPLTIAKCFRSAVKDMGADPKVIHDAAFALREATEERYMPEASTWLDTQGWRTYEAGLQPKI